MSSALWPHGDPAAVARSILSESAYKTAPAPPPQTDLLQEIFDALDRLFKPLTDWLQRAVGASRPVGNLITILLLLLLAGVVVWMLFRIVRSVVAATSGTREAPAAAGELQRRRSAAEWRAAAERAAASGDFARAVTALFGAAQAELDESSIVPFDPAKTPGEYRRVVRTAAAGIAVPFDSLATAFVRAAFAERQTDRAEYARALAAFESLSGRAA